MTAGTVVVVASLALSLQGQPGAQESSPPPAQPQEPASVAPGITYPSVIYSPNPAYTREAMRARIEGGVTLAVVIQPDGTVGDVAVVKSLDPTFGLDASAIEAAKKWRFQPATRDGKPVAVKVT